GPRLPPWSRSAAEAGERGWGGWAARAPPGSGPRGGWRDAPQPALAAPARAQRRPGGPAANPPPAPGGRPEPRRAPRGARRRLDRLNSHTTPPGLNEHSAKASPATSAGIAVLCPKRPMGMRASLSTLGAGVPSMSGLVLQTAYVWY